MTDGELKIIDSLMTIVKAELIKATQKFGSFNSAHEGYAVIKEELDELWDCIKLKSPSIKREMFNEAIQVAAMGIRFVFDCCVEKSEVS